MKCDMFDIGCKLDSWVAHKWDTIISTFWDFLDVGAMVILVCIIFLSMFGLSTKKAATWVIAIYVLAKIIQVGG